MDTRNRVTTAVASLALSMIIMLVPGCGDKLEVAVGETAVSVTYEKPGRGRAAENGDVICIDYRATTEEGEEVTWGKDFCFELGAGATISGLDEACVGMKAGGRRTIRCPPHKHWGTGGYSDKIPPRTLLMIEIKLTSIE